MPNSTRDGRANKFLLTTGALLPALLCTSALLRERASSYSGKSLDHWVLAIGKRSWENPPSERDLATAHEAITHLGTNAIPYLLRWIRYPAPSQQHIYISRYVDFKLEWV